MRQFIQIQTEVSEVLIDITGQIGAFVLESGVQNGLVVVYAQGATGAIMIQEN